MLRNATLPRKDQMGKKKLGLNSPFTRRSERSSCLRTLSTLLFIDIETVPRFEYWNEVPVAERQLFEKKTAYLRKDVLPEIYYERAGIWAEFGKVICISTGFFTSLEPTRKFCMKSFYHRDEHQLLKAFKRYLYKEFNCNTLLFCAHNGKEFDFPYLARRMLIHNISLPKALEFFGKKPWEIHHIDTLELWKFGDFKHYTSLALLSYILGIPSPKTAMEGSDVARVYYRDKDLRRIVRYCERDMLTVAQVYLRLNDLPLLQAAELQGQFG